MELDDLHFPPGKPAARKTTLLRAAALQGQAVIGSALIRAGADASVYYCTCTGSAACTAGVRARVAAAQPSYATWIMGELVRSQVPGVAGSSTRARCNCCEGGCSCSLVRLGASCGHVACEACFWGRAVLWEEVDDPLGQGWCCPICAKQRPASADAVPMPAAALATALAAAGLAAVDGGKGAGPLAEPGGSSAAAVGPSADAAEALADAERKGFSPARMKAESLARFLALPVDRQLLTTPGGKARAPKKLPFQALPRTASAATRLGTFRSARSDALFCAAARGYRLRVAAIIGAGADVDGGNEYGQTPIFVAAWNGRRDVCELLLEAGSTLRGDSAGCTPAQAAAVAGHVQLAKLLEDAAAAAAVAQARGAAADQARAAAELPSALPAGPVGRPTAGAAWVAEALAVTVLIPVGDSHPGAGAVCVDNALDESFLLRLEALHDGLPRIAAEKPGCSDRALFCDVLGWAVAGIGLALRRCRERCGREEAMAGCAAATCSEALPQLRFLHYRTIGRRVPSPLAAPSLLHTCPMLTRHGGMPPAIGPRLRCSHALPRPGPPWPLGAVPLPRPPMSCSRAT